MTNLNEEERLRKASKEISGIIISMIPKPQLISLYLTGRLFSKDKTSKSDFDFFAVVTDDFDPRFEEEINNALKANPDIRLHRRIGFRIFYISNFSGETKKMPPICKSLRDIKLYLKFFRTGMFKLLYGKKIDFQEFPLESLSDRDELKLDIDLLCGNIDYFKKHNYHEKEPYPNMYNTAKFVLHLCRLEARLSGKSDYEVYFYKLTRMFTKNHIFHEALSIRDLETPLNLEEKKEFVSKVMDYISKLKKECLS